MVVQCSVGRYAHPSYLDETQPTWRYENGESPIFDSTTTPGMNSAIELLPRRPPQGPGVYSPERDSTTRRRSTARSFGIGACDKFRAEPMASTCTIPSSPSFAKSSASFNRHEYGPKTANLDSKIRDESPLPSPAATASPQPISTKHLPSVLQKRRRHLSDVDGIDTAELSIKKRRLRLQLITSRLSLPFSVPATHILNRESIAGLPGDGKRFVKLAAYLSARRAAASAAQHTTTNHNPASVDLLRRAAVLNRVRMVMNTALDLNKSEFARQRSANTAAVVAHHGMQLVSAARYFFPSPATPAPPPPQHQNIPPRATAQNHYHHTPSHVYVAPGPTPVTQHYGALLPRTPPPQCGDVNPPNPQTRARQVEYHHAKLPPSPKLKASRTIRGGKHGQSPLAASPEMRPARERDFDDEDELDNDNVSFPGSELGNIYADDSDEDEGEQGYDLGALFGTGVRGDPTPDEIDEMEFESLDDESEDQSEHFYEEYLDELDGIPRGPLRV